MSKSILYVNGSYQNAVTLDITMEEEIYTMFDITITWRTLIEKIFQEKDFGAYDDEKLKNDEDIKEWLDREYW